MEREIEYFVNLCGVWWFADLYAKKPHSLSFSIPMLVGYEVGVVPHLIGVLIAFLYITVVAPATSSFPLSSFYMINHPASIYVFHSLPGSFWYDPAASVNPVVLNFSWGVSLVLQRAKSSFSRSWDLWRGSSYFVLPFIHGDDWDFSSFRVLGLRVMLQHIQ